MFWKDMRSVHLLAYPHFGLSLGLRFHSQGLPELSRQLHVVAVVVKTAISWALGSPGSTGESV